MPSSRGSGGDCSHPLGLAHLWERQEDSKPALGLCKFTYRGTGYPGQNMHPYSIDDRF